MGSDELWHHQLSKNLPLLVTDVLGGMLLWLVSIDMEMRALSIRWDCSGHLTATGSSTGGSGRTPEEALGQTWMLATLCGHGTGTLTLSFPVFYETRKHSGICKDEGLTILVAQQYGFLSQTAWVQVLASKSLSMSQCLSFFI